MPERNRALVVSHPCVVSVNQAVYAELRNSGWDVQIVVPHRWRHEYAEQSFAPRALDGMTDVVHPIRVALAGRPQRHFYLCRPGAVIRRFRPDVLFVEQEPFSIAAMQWSLAARRHRLPFGVQADENLDRPLPLVARLIRSAVLDRASFVAARSPAAGALVGRFGARGDIALIPHAVPEWEPLQRNGRGEFTIGFAGRLVPEKGIFDLVSAVERLQEPVRLLIVGDGPLRAELESVHLRNAHIEIRTDFTHERMPEAYAQMDVLVLPSRTTRRWAEQFGRVLAEALWCGVPVVGSDSGEIPWVIETTQGGLTYAEGDAAALATALAALRDDPERRRRLAELGREAVRDLFGAHATARKLGSVLADAAGVRSG